MIQIILQGISVKITILAVLVYSLPHPLTIFSLHYLFLDDLNKSLHIKNTGPLDYVRQNLPQSLLMGYFS